MGTEREGCKGVECVGVERQECSCVYWHTYKVESFPIYVHTSCKQFTTYVIEIFFQNDERPIHVHLITNNCGSGRYLRHIVSSRLDVCMSM